MESLCLRMPNASSLLASNFDDYAICIYMNSVWQSKEVNCVLTVKRTVEGQRIVQSLFQASAACAC